MLKIAHVGCGGMSAAWLEALKGLPQVELVALIDLRLEAAQLARDLYAPAAFAGNDFDSFIKENPVDAVFNCTIPEAHFPVTMAALQQGCHVLTEKPLANTLSEAQKMIQAAQQTERVLSVIQNRRYQRSIRFIRNCIESGKIGEVSELAADYYMGPRFGGFREEMDSPLLLDMAIHHFDMARFLAGGNPRTVFCHEWNPPQSWYRSGGSAHALFQFENGLVFNYRGSWCADGAPTSWNAAWRIIGSKGSILWDGDDQVQIEVVDKVSGFLPKARIQKPKIPAATDYESGHASLIHEFIDCIRSGRKPETHAEDNIHSLAMVFKAIESSRKGRRVKVHFRADK